MDCEICFEKFDHSLNKPLSLYKCGHTLCALCFKRLNNKTCPMCNTQIEDTSINWVVLKQVAESEYDMERSEVVKNLSETIKCTEEKKEQNNNLAKLFKNQVENHCNKTHINQINSYKKQLFSKIEKKMKKSEEKAVKLIKNEVENHCADKIKQITVYKKQLFLEIETQIKDKNKQFDELALSFKQSDDEIKTKVENNDLTKEELLNLNQKLSQQNKELKNKLNTIVDVEQSVIIYILFLNFAIMYTYLLFI
jgi:hypothetical protein